MSKRISGEDIREDAIRAFWDIEQIIYDLFDTYPGCEKKIRNLKSDYLKMKHKISKILDKDTKGLKL